MNEIVDEVARMRDRHAMRRMAGLDIGDRITVPISDLIPGYEVPPDARSVEYTVVAVDSERFKLATTASPRVATKRPATKQRPPVPPWARTRGRR